MPHCERCGQLAPRNYCSHCEEKVYELKRSWDALVLDFMDDIAAMMKRAFQGLEERDGIPIPLELLAEAWYGQSELAMRTYRGQFAQIWERLKRPDPSEFPTERELREIRGDERCHAIMDGERV